jgi:hypothetical protein
MATDAAGTTEAEGAADVDATVATELAGASGAEPELRTLALGAVVTLLRPVFGSGP